MSSNCAINEISVNGVAYVKKDAVMEETERQIVIVASGWIFIGLVADGEKEITISGGSVVRKWSNGKGIGALATLGHKDEYTLDAVYGLIQVPYKSIRARISCDW